MVFWCVTERMRVRKEQWERELGNVRGREFNGWREKRRDVKESERERARENRLSEGKRTK